MSNDVREGNGGSTQDKAITSSLRICCFSVIPRERVPQTVGENLTCFVHLPSPCKVIPTHSSWFCLCWSNNLLSWGHWVSDRSDDIDLFTTDDKDLLEAASLRKTRQSVSVMLSFIVDSLTRLTANRVLQRAWSCNLCFLIRETQYSSSHKPKRNIDVIQRYTM